MSLGTNCVRKWLNRWLPPGLRDLFNRWSGHAIYYRGTYSEWEQAVAAASGYAEANLSQRIEQAALKVKHGEAVWEQDGVTRDHIPSNFPLFACLSRIALVKEGRLSVLDYGGALGSTYHQCRAFLPEICGWRWHIVEQPHVVKSGSHHFQTDELRFHVSMEECLKANTPDVVILSSVLQYLQDPYDLLERIGASSIKYLIIDRHPCSSTQELITVQVVPPSLYPASYPSWLFDCEKMKLSLSHRYERLMEWEGMDPPIRGRGIDAQFSGFFLRKREQI